MAQSEFIDLYELLQLPVDADLATVKKRLSAVYIEAQNNLDHRNAPKRLQYQQMYEIILPQARHLLLDANRRVEYDRYLTAYRSGKPLSQVETRPVQQETVESISEIPEMLEAEEKVDPEVLAAQREELWNKWKSGLDLSDPAPATPAAPKLAAPKTAGPRPAGSSAPLNPAPKVGQQIIDKPGTYVASAARRSAAEIAAAEEAEAQQKAEFDRQRAKHREEMMQSLAQTTILYWTFGVGAGAMIVLCGLLFVLDNYFAANGSYPVFGLERGIFMGVCFALDIVLAAVAAFFGGRKGRARTIEQLSPLSYEELQRRTR